MTNAHLRENVGMKRVLSIPAIVLIASLVVVTVFAGCGKQSDDTVTQTFELKLDGEVDQPDDRLFVLTYFYSSELEPAELADALTKLYTGNPPGEPPESLVQKIGGFCGPDGWADQVGEALGMEVTKDDAGECRGDKTYSVKLEVPRGTAIHYSLDTALLSNLDDSETFGGNTVGDPMDLPTAEDFDVLEKDERSEVTYTFKTGGQ